MIKLILLILFMPLLSYGEDNSDFSEIVSQMSTLEGKFSQIVTDQSNNIIQDVEGNFLFKKPNFFKWNYDKPFQSQIICDGELLYLYDPDLKQVIISALSKLGGISPAMLLVSTSTAKHFNIRTVTRNNSQFVFEAQPKKNQEATFKKVLIYFNNKKLSQMNIFDNFDHKTEILFKRLVSNKKINDASFLFNIPEDVDVIKN